MLPNSDFNFLLDAKIPVIDIYDPDWEFDKI